MPCTSSTCSGMIGFPTIWLPDPATRELRALLMHRLRLVRIQTRLKNGVQALALNQGLVRGSKLLRRVGLAQLQALPLPPYTAQRRDQSLDLLGPSAPISIISMRPLPPLPARIPTRPAC